MQTNVGAGMTLEIICTRVYFLSVTLHSALNVMQESLEV